MRVAPDGSCLYHSVAEGLLRRGIGDTAWPAGPAWRPGPAGAAGAPRRRAGNMRRVLLRYIDALEADGADLGAYLMAGDTPAALRARVEARCQLGTGTCGWAEYGEVALLASLFGVCITVFLAKEGYVPTSAVGATARGAMDTGDTVREFRAGCESGRAKLMVLNVDSTHFDALVPCAE